MEKLESSQDKQKQKQTEEKIKDILIQLSDMFPGPEWEKEKTQEYIKLKNKFHLGMNIYYERYPNNTFITWIQDLPIKEFMKEMYINRFKKKIAQNSPQF